MSNFITICELKQQTPMIHFQHAETGACLRGSDVKPRLDRFLLEQIGKGDATPHEAGKAIANSKGWLIGDGAHPALKYKVQILAEGTPKKSNEIDIDKRSLDNHGRTGRERPLQGENKINRSYFGNMVDVRRLQSLDEKKEAVETAYRETVFYSQPIQLKVICFIPELSKFICEHILGFFLLNNFGTRAGKGFGSFIVTTVDGEKVSTGYEKQIARYFLEPFYKIEYPIHNDYMQMNDIADIYQLMKSGYNDGNEAAFQRAFIYQYMHEKSIGNEKAWMKRRGIAPIVATHANTHNGEHDQQRNFQDSDYKYVRAILGVGDNVSYINRLDNNGRPDFHYGKTTVNISSKNENIERYHSPIIFKVVDRYTFMLLYTPDPMIFNRQFHFEGQQGGDIWTPPDFDMSDFMDKFANYINSSITQSKIRNAQRLHFQGQLVKCQGGGASYV